MNYYGNPGYSHLQQQTNPQQQNQQQQRGDYNIATPSYSAPHAELAPQHSSSHSKLQQNQTVFHCRVRDMYFSSWQGQQQTHHHQQQQHQQTQQQESVWQGHKNPKVYEGDEVHCFNIYCQMTFRFSQQLVQHILRGECGEITMNDVTCVARDWKALQIELGRCGKLSGDEISCLERAWELLQGEQAKSGKITRELIGFLVLAWEMLSGNRSMYTLTQPTASSSLIPPETSMGEVDQTWRARFRYSTGNVKR